MPTSARLPINRIARWPAFRWAACRRDTITLAHLDKFSHIGMFSGGSISTNEHYRPGCLQGEGQSRVHQLRQPRTRPGQSERRRSGRLRRRSQGEHRRTQGRRHKHLLLRVSAHRARVAVLAAQPPRICTVIVKFNQKNKKPTTGPAGELGTILPKFKKTTTTSFLIKKNY